MRTKTLLLAGALSLAGLATSLAQSNVYSLNVVGYINLNLQPGFQIVANQLDVDGTGTNNTVTTAFGTNVPSGTKVFWFNPATATTVSASFLGGNWIGGGATVKPGVQPGAAVWVQVPSATTVTLVGNVLQGNVSVPLVTGFQMVGSKVPQAGGLTSVLGFTPVNQDKTFQWVNATANYASKTYVGSWLGGEPNIAVGEGFWLNAHAGSLWNRTFTVQ